MGAGPHRVSRAYTAVGQAPEEVVRSTNPAADRPRDRAVRQALCTCGSTRGAGGRYWPARVIRRRCCAARTGRSGCWKSPAAPCWASTPGRVPPHGGRPRPRLLLALYTDGLVESPDVDFEDALADLAHRLSEAGDLPLDELADHLVRHEAGAEERPDDIALMLLRARD